MTRRHGAHVACGPHDNDCTRVISGRERRWMLVSCHCQYIFSLVGPTPHSYLFLPPEHSERESETWALGPAELYSSGGWAHTLHHSFLATFIHCSLLKCWICHLATCTVAFMVNYMSRTRGRQLLSLLRARFGFSLVGPLVYTWHFVNGPSLSPSFFFFNKKCDIILFRI